MGDRANVYLVLDGNPPTGLYLYTHWAGSEWHDRAKAAVKAAWGRWNDEPYFNRIVITELFKDLVGETTGGGISLEMCDNEHDIVVIDRAQELVATCSPGREKDHRAWRNKVSFHDL
jgi:hypothetical protein